MVRIANQKVSEIIDPGAKVICENLSSFNLPLPLPSYPLLLANYIIITSSSSLRNPIACASCTGAHSCGRGPKERVRVGGLWRLLHESNRVLLLLVEV